ncbi:MAG: TauD/TfdA family dioxygenase [Acidimicrobiia bacterium]
MAERLEPIDGPAVWRGTELAERTDWIRSLEASEADELRAEGRRLAELDLDVSTATAGDAPLPGLADLVAWTDAQLRTGSGAVLLRGVPVQDEPDVVSAGMFLALGLHLGAPMHQNAQGDLICHVRDTGRTYDDPTARAYQVPDGLPFHSDASDVVALLCLRTAKVGGLSRIVSTATLHNEVLARRPDLAPLLYGPWHFDRRGEEGGYDAPYYTSPICSRVDDVFSMTFGPGIIRSAQRHEATPRLTPGQIELLALMDEIVEEPGMSYDMDLEPGDVQLLLNYSVVHSRTHYQDWEDPARKRHLLRLWLRQPTPRPVAPGFGRHFVIPQAEPLARLSELAALR